LWPILKNLSNVIGLRSFRLFLSVLLLTTAGVGVYRSIHGGSDFDWFYNRAAEFSKTGELSSEHAVRRYPPTFQIFLFSHCFCFPKAKKTFSICGIPKSQLIVIEYFSTSI
jgi:hypothetical protein